MRRALLAGLIAAALSGGFAYANPTAQGVQVPTLGEHHALEQRVADLEQRVAALEAAPPSTTTTTTVPPTTTTTSTSTTSTTLPAIGEILASDGVVRCDNCLVQGVEGFVYTSVNLNGRRNVTLQNVVVDGSQGDSGPLQSGTINARDTEGVDIINAHVMNSPRSCISIEGSSNMRILNSTFENCTHLGIHGGFISNITIEGNVVRQFSLGVRDGWIDQGWESGGMKLTNGQGVIVRDNEVYDGYGPGIWFDIYVSGSEIVSNHVHDVTGEGVFVEISRDVGVSANLVERAPNSQSMSRMSWCYGAGILVSTSDGVQVAGNVVTESVHGILVIDQSWRDDTPSGYAPDQYSIVGNTVTNVDKVGACQDVGRQTVFAGEWRDNTLVNVRSLLPPL